MVKVSYCTSDQMTAWRIRDVLAAHPLLGGATAHIDVTASHERIVLEGWTIDEELRKSAVALAIQVAGRRAVEPRISVRSATRA